MYRWKLGNHVLVTPIERNSVDIKWICCDICNDFHGFWWRDVCYDELREEFIAPSKERLEEALKHITLRVLRTS